MIRKLLLLALMLAPGVALAQDRSLFEVVTSPPGTVGASCPTGFDVYLLDASTGLVWFCDAGSWANDGIVAALDQATGTLAIANGGTGATSAGDARTNLGAASAADLAAHEADAGNPHGVTAAQVGAPTTTQELSDVAAVAPSEGQALVYTSGAYTPTTLETGGGDMEKSTYDVDDNSAVDAADNALALGGSAAANFPQKPADEIITGLWTFTDFTTVDGNLTWDPDAGSQGALILGTPSYIGSFDEGSSRLDVETSADSSYNHGIRIIAGANNAELLHGYNEEGEHVFRLNTTSAKGSSLELLDDNESVAHQFGTNGDPYAVINGGLGDRITGDQLSVLGNASISGRLAVNTELVAPLISGAGTGLLLDGTNSGTEDARLAVDSFSLLGDEANQIGSEGYLLLSADSDNDNLGGQAIYLDTDGDQGTEHSITKTGITSYPGWDFTWRVQQDDRHFVIQGDGPLRLAADGDGDSSPADAYGYIDFAFNGAAGGCTYRFYDDGIDTNCDGTTDELWSDIGSGGSGGGAAESLDADGDGSLNVAVIGSEIEFDPDDDNTPDLTLSTTGLQFAGQGNIRSPEQMYFRADTDGTGPSEGFFEVVLSGATSGVRFAQDTTPNTTTGAGESTIRSRGSQSLSFINDPFDYETSGSPHDYEARVTMGTSDNANWSTAFLAPDSDYQGMTLGANVDLFGDGQVDEFIASYVKDMFAETVRVDTDSDGTPTRILETGVDTDDDGAVDKLWSDIGGGGGGVTGFDEDGTYYRFDLDEDNAGFLMLENTLFYTENKTQTTPASSLVHISPTVWKMGENVVAGDRRLKIYGEGSSVETIRLFYDQSEKDTILWSRELASAAGSTSTFNTSYSLLAYDDGSDKLMFGPQTSGGFFRDGSDGRVYVGDGIVANLYEELNVSGGVFLTIQDTAPVGYVSGSYPLTIVGDDATGTYEGAAIQLTTKEDDGSGFVDIDYRPSTTSSTTNQLAKIRFSHGDSFNSIGSIGFYVSETTSRDNDVHQIFGVSGWSKAIVVSGDILVDSNRDSTYTEINDAGVDTDRDGNEDHLWSDIGLDTESWTFTDDVSGDGTAQADIAADFEAGGDSLLLAEAVTLKSLSCWPPSSMDLDYDGSFNAGTLSVNVVNGASDADLSVTFNTASQAAYSHLTDTSCTSNCSVSAGTRIKLYSDTNFDFESGSFICVLTVEK